MRARDNHVRWVGVWFVAIVGVAGFVLTFVDMFGLFDSLMIGDGDKLSLIVGLLSLLLIAVGVEMLRDLGLIQEKIDSTKTLIHQDISTVEEKIGQGFGGI